MGTLITCTHAKTFTNADGDHCTAVVISVWQAGKPRVASFQILRHNPAGGGTLMVKEVVWKGENAEYNAGLHFESFWE